MGCMRPKGSMRGETDVLALKAGVDAIAFPSEEAVKYAAKHGLEDIVFFLLLRSNVPDATLKRRNNQSSACLNIMLLSSYGPC